MLSGEEGERRGDIPSHPIPSVNLDYLLSLKGKGRKSAAVVAGKEEGGKWDWGENVGRNSKRKDMHR